MAIVGLFPLLWVPDTRCKMILYSILGFSNINPPATQGLSDQDTAEIETHRERGRERDRDKQTERERERGHL